MSKISPISILYIKTQHLSNVRNQQLFKKKTLCFWASLTSVTVRLHAVSVLHSVIPCALVPGRRVEALSNSVAALHSVAPLPSVGPPAPGLHTEPVAFPLLPVALVRVPAGPGVNAHCLETVGPRARILTLALGSGAHAVAVGFPVVPASAVGAPIIKVETTTRHSETERRKEAAYR